MPRHLPQGDPNVPAGQLTLDVDLSRPVHLPELESQWSMDELSRLVLAVHEQVQRHSPSDPSSLDVELGAGGKEGQMSGASGQGSEVPPAGVPQKPQNFVLPLGVMARNEVYPRTCKMW